MRKRTGLIFLLATVFLFPIARSSFAAGEDTNGPPSTAPTEMKANQPLTAPSGNDAVKEGEKPKRRMPPWGDKFPEADSIFRVARTTMKDELNAPEFVASLEETIRKYPEYPMKGFLLYYLGLNARTGGDFAKATQAFKEALKAKPDIAYKTPIVSYLKTAKNGALLRIINIVCIAVLLISVLPSLIALTRESAADLPWGRMLAVYGVVLALWAAIALLLPRLYGSLAIEPGLYPKPTLSNASIGQIGDGALRALLGYGLFAILATLPVVVAVSRLKTGTVRTFAGIFGVIAVVGSLMGLYTARHLYTDSRYDGTTNRLVFFIKSITDPDEIPGVMFPLFDEQYRKHLIKERTVPVEEKYLK
jgi:hypothetical protein